MYNGMRNRFESFDQAIALLYGILYRQQFELNVQNTLKLGSTLCLKKQNSIALRLQSLCR